MSSASWRLSPLHGPCPARARGPVHRARGQDTLNGPPPLDGILVDLRRLGDSPSRAAMPASAVRRCAAMARPRILCIATKTPRSSSRLPSITRHERRYESGGTVYPHRSNSTAWFAARRASSSLPLARATNATVVSLVVNDPRLESPESLPLANNSPARAESPPSAANTASSPANHSRCHWGVHVDAIVRSWRRLRPTTRDTTRFP